jgi:hypothetical protein
VLTSREEQVWDDVQRYWSEEAQEPARPAPSALERSPGGEIDVRVAVAIGVRVAIVLLLFGAAAAALAVALATAIGWALYRNRSPRRDPTRREP